MYYGNLLLLQLRKISVHCPRSVKYQKPWALHHLKEWKPHGRGTCFTSNSHGCHWFCKKHPFLDTQIEELQQCNDLKVWIWYFKIFHAIQMVPDRIWHLDFAQIHRMIVVSALLSKLPALGGLEITWSHVHPIPHKLFDWLIYVHWCWSKIALCFCNEDILVYVCHVHMFYTHWLNILMYQHQQPFHGILTSVTAGPGAAFTWRQASFLHHWRTGPKVSSPSRYTDYVSS